MASLGSFADLQILPPCRRNSRNVFYVFDGFGYRTVVAHFVLILSSAMNRQRVKTFLATILAAVLLYYDAAWAVLRCCHVDDHGSVEESLATGDPHYELDRHLSRSSQVPPQIDCLDFDYQMEVLAGPTAPPQFQRSAAAITPYGNDFFVLKSLVDGHRKNLFRNSLTRGSPLAEPSDPPLYLSLSTLRI